MIDKQIKNNILKKYELKEEKFFVSGLIDKVQKFLSNNVLVYTNFLDLNELQISKYVLDALKIDYLIYKVNEDAEKQVIFIVPDYMKDIVNFFDYIVCIKITPKNGVNLFHKDYMGSIYNLGIKSEMIGDIFVNNKCSYIYIMKSIFEYIDTNMQKVGKQDVTIQKININLDECKNLKHQTIRLKIISASMRVDAVLSEVYNLSRSEVVEKISKGDLFINSKENFIKNKVLLPDDIVSFKRYGKIKIGQVINKTKSDKIVLDIEKYI